VYGNLTKIKFKIKLLFNNSLRRTKMEKEAAFRYKAFISYRHVDPDMQAARELHRQIESYGIPGAARQSSGMKKMGRVFRDQEELPTSIDLSQDINNALRESEWLIVVCSPRLIQSRWCLKEIDTFIELGKRDHILTLLAEGEPEESFPEQLRFITSADGTAEEIEPLAADIRAADWPGMKKKLKTEKLRLLAPMLGVAFDDLRRRQRERFLRMAAAIAGAAILGLSSFLAYALRQNALVTSERNAALTSQSLFLADLSRQELAKGDPALAMLLAKAALPATLEKPNRPLVEEAAAALKTAELSLAGGQFVPVTVLPLTKPYENMHESFGNLRFLTGDDGESIVRVLSSDYGAFAQVTDWNGRTGAMLRSESLAVGNPSFVYLDPSGGVVLSYGDYAEILPLWDKEKIRVPFLQPFDYPELRQNPNAPELLLFFQYDHAELYDARTGKTISFGLPLLPNTKGFDEEKTARPLIFSAALSDDGSRVALGFEEGLIAYRGENGETHSGYAYLGDLVGAVYDAQSGEKLADLNAPALEGAAREGGTKALLYNPRGDILASVSNRGNLRLWDGATGRLLVLAEEILHSDPTVDPIHRQLLSFHEEGRLLAAVSGAGDIAVLDLQGELVKRISGQNRKVTGVEWGRNGKKDLLLVWEDGEAGSVAILYDGIRFSQIMSLASDQPALRAEFCPADEPAIALWRRHSLQIWRSGAGEDLARRFPTGYTYLFMEWSPDGRYAAVGGVNRVSVFDSASGALLNEIETHKMETSGDNLTSLHWSADGRRLTASWAKGVFVLDPLTGTELWQPQIVPPEMTSPIDQKSLAAGDAAESPDGDLLAVTREFGQNVAVYSAAGELICQFRHPADWTSNGIMPLKWSPDSRSIVTSLAYFNEKGERDMSRDNAIVWDARTGEKLARLSGHYAAFALDGRHLATATDESLTLYDAADFAMADSLPLTADGKIADVLFSPDGKLVACGNLIWNPESGSSATLVNAADSGNAELTTGDIVGFSPDSSACLAGNAIYDADSGKPVLTLPGTGVTWSPIAFNAQGTAVLLETSDRVAAAVTVPDLAQAYALGLQLTGGRELTPAERQRFFLAQ
jgi:WD40 repeat protein